MNLYRTIVVDPPWQTTAGRKIGIYSKSNFKQDFGVINNNSRKLSYPTMTVSEIANIKIPAANNCHLYLWTINKYLADSFMILDMWGFKYSTTLVWAKNPMGGGLGGAYGLASEFIIFARKGSLKTLDRVGRNWFNWKRPYKNGYPHHSAKPDEFFDLVETISPGPRLEMFARKKRKNWDCWGNEVDSDIDLVATAGLEPATSGL